MNIELLNQQYKMNSELYESLCEFFSKNNIRDEWQNFSLSSLALIIFCTNFFSIKDELNLSIMTINIGKNYDYLLIAIFIINLFFCFIYFSKLYIVKQNDFLLKWKSAELNYRLKIFKNDTDKLIKIFAEKINPEADLAIQELKKTLQKKTKYKKPSFDELEQFFNSPKEKIENQDIKKENKLQEISDEQAKLQLISYLTTLLSESYLTDIKKLLRVRKLTFLINFIFPALLFIISLISFTAYWNIF